MVESAAYFTQGENLYTFYGISQNTLSKMTL